MEIAHFNWSTAGLRMMRTSTEKREIHQGKKQFGDGETMEKTNKLSHEIPQPPMLSREPNPSKEGICGLGQEGAKILRDSPTSQVMCFSTKTRSVFDH